MTPTDVMASMAGVDFVRAIFDGTLPAPPIMQTIEPFDSTAEPGVVVMHSHSRLPALQSDRLRAWRLRRDVAGFRRWGWRCIRALPAGTGYTTLEFKVSFIKGMTKDSGVVRTEGRTLNVGRRAATAEARITDAKGRLLAHATTTCLVFEIPKRQ